MSLSTVLWDHVACGIWMWEAGAYIMAKQLHLHWEDDQGVGRGCGKDEGGREGVSRVGEYYIMMVTFRCGDIWFDLYMLIDLRVLLEFNTY